tara:strand:- start:34207 stop:35415 length:1209 start_codon:yes stop_codon:yes gene_type:complete
VTNADRITPLFLLKSLLNLGITPATGLWLAGKIRLLNAMCIANSLLVLSMVGLDLAVSEHHDLSLVAGAIGLVMMLPCYLNYRGQHIAARIVFLSVAYISICALAIVFGERFQFQYYLIPGVGMSLIFFRDEIGWGKWAFTLVGVPLWLFLELWFDAHAPILAIEGDYPDIIAYFSGVLIFLTTIIMYATFTREADRHLEGIHAVNRQLKDMALKDALTGLFNRRYISDELKKCVQLAADKGQFLALAMFDMDHFKRINDTHGHDAGDKVLQAVARLAQQNLRESDQVGRIGGEEFCIIFTQGKHDSIQQAVERLRSAISGHTITYAGETIHLSASFGIAYAPDAKKTGAKRTDAEGYVSAGMLFKQADAALYQAKSEGRNRVVTYTGDHENNLNKTGLPAE